MCLDVWTVFERVYVNNQWESRMFGVANKLWGVRVAATQPPAMLQSTVVTGATVCRT